MSTARPHTLIGTAQQIGINYLAKHPKKNYLHTNQGTAYELKTLDPSLTQTELERNLITFYLDLPNRNGELAHAIEDFFLKTLNKALTVGVINDYWDSASPWSHAWNIGNSYLIKHPKPGLFHLHTNQEIAKEIASMPMNLSTEEIAKKLMNCYMRLPNFHGQLAVSIRAFINKFLQTPLTQQMLIDNVSIETYQKIGQDYLEKYPQEKKRMLFSHTNHQYARAMFQGEVLINNGTCRITETVKDSKNSIWNAFLDIYKLLPFNNGYLANRIERLFQNVFSVTFDDLKSVGNTRVSVHVPREQIAADVADKIKPFLVTVNTIQAPHA